MGMWHSQVLTNRMTCCTQRIATSTSFTIATQHSRLWQTDIDTKRPMALTSAFRFHPPSLVCVSSRLDTTKPSVMKLSLLLACTIAIATQNHGCSSLPFGSRPKKSADNTDAAEEQDPPPSNDNTQEEQQQEKTAVRGAASKVSTSLQDVAAASSSLSIVETFFQSGASGEVLSDELQTALHEMANDPTMQSFLQTTRRSLHRHPELMYDLPFTSDTISTILTELNVQHTTGWAKNTRQDVYPGPGGYGVVAHIGTMKPDEPCIILRADMDALPIDEATPNIDTFKSHNPHKMHACGHDGHTTMLLGAAALLKKVEEEIVGTVRLVFQPAEEGGAGMKRMVEEGVVTTNDLAAQLAFGMHVWPALPTGTVASKPGPLMGAAEMFTVALHGKGGHAAMPHNTIDPIVAASHLVSNLQSIVSRTLSPLESGIVSVTAINAGDAFNVIPASATLKGTIRALSTEMLLNIRGKVEHMAKTTAVLHGCNATVSYMPDFYPPVVNDAKLFQWSSQVGQLLSNEENMRIVEPTMGAEDFAFLAESIPSTFFFIGQGSGGNEEYHIPRTDYGLHHPAFALDEEVLPMGVELHVNLALRSLKKLLMDGDEDSEEVTKAEL
mmetsp:Transcript_6524/g.14412  ORF Transcript_6524/g.14412 Transcript_6524/m.14412 type:complete len:611 (+) Transcript_6524:652-2484(+)